MSKLNGKALLRFKVVFPSYITNNDPTAGDITVAGTTVTLTVADLLSPSHVANKIASTAIVGWEVIAQSNGVVTLENLAIGVVTNPGFPVLDTALNIYFYDIEYFAGYSEYPIDPKYGYPVFTGSTERFDFTTLAAAPTDPIFILGDSRISVALNPTAATVALEYTLALPSEVRVDPTACTWTPWPSADVIVYTEDILDSPVTAVRLNFSSVTGDCSLYLKR